MESVRKEQVIREDQISLWHLEASHSHGEQKRLQKNTLELLQDTKRKARKIARSDAARVADSYQI